MPKLNLVVVIVSGLWTKNGFDLMQGNFKRIFLPASYKQAPASQCLDAVGWVTGSAFSL